MGFLERAIRKGISQGVGNAIGKAVSQAIEPKATELANKAAQHIDNAASQTVQHTSASVSGLDNAFSNLERAAGNYVTEMSRNMKICPACEQPTDAEKKFCPSCGTKLPEQTVAESAVCTSCGTQNSIGTKFCTECGAKLPAAIQAEQAAEARDAQVLAEWDQYLPQYPKWSGGYDYNIEQLDVNAFMFVAEYESHFAAQSAVGQYREILYRNGFRQAGQYPNEWHLYKMLGNVCYHVDTEHCFESDSNRPMVYFDISEPIGGYNYVKPEPKAPTSLRDLFKF